METTALFNFDYGKTLDITFYNKIYLLHNINLFSIFRDYYIYLFPKDYLPNNI